MHRKFCKACFESNEMTIDDYETAQVYNRKQEKKKEARVFYASSFTGIGQTSPSKTREATKSSRDRSRGGTVR
jgi:hypothetical protein